MSDAMDLRQTFDDIDRRLAPISDCAQGSAEWWSRVCYQQGRMAASTMPDPASRDSCPFTKPERVTDWQRGYDDYLQQREVYVHQQRDKREKGTR